MFTTNDKPVKGARITINGYARTRTFVVSAIGDLTDGLVCVVRIGRTKELVKYIGEA